MAVTFYTFQVSVTTSGTPVQLETFSVEEDQTVLVKAKAANTGVIHIGNSSDTALNSNSENFKLEAGQSVEIKVPNTNEIWIDSTQNGDGVEVVVGGGGGSSGGGSGSATPGGVIQTAGADAGSNTADAQYVAARNYGFNGSTWDRIKAGITTVTATLTGFLNTLPWGIYHATPATRTDGQGGPLETDTAGNLKTREQYAPAAEDNVNGVIKVEQRFQAAYISSATTTQVKSGAGFLHAIVVGETAAGAISVIDNTSGSTVNIGQLKSSIVEGTYILDCEFAAGLRIITAAASKITIIYR